MAGGRGLLRLALLWLLLACLGAALAGNPLGWMRADELPPEARATLSLIQRGGPFPYVKDGAVFGNYERVLPSRARGYYREYTVPTPGVRHRGGRRIVAGAVGEYYYSADHYRTFNRIVERK